MKIKLLIFSILLLFFFVIQLKSGLGLSTPIYSLNSTNSTLAGTAISHNLKWNDDVGLSGYIFQFCNGTWNGTHCGPLPGWSYRRPITINNTLNSNTLTDYQILVNLDTASLISQGKMRSDCGDIRFTDSDEATLLNYWLESGCNSANTKIWVKVPNIPASSTKTIYLYYGNTNVNSESNFTSVFQLAAFNNTNISSGNDTSPGSCPPSTTIDYWTNFCRSDYQDGEGPEKRDDENSIPGHNGYAYIAASNWNVREMIQNLTISGYIPSRFSFNGRSAPTASGTCIPCGINGVCGRSSVGLKYFDSFGNQIGEVMFWWYFYGLTSQQITDNCGILNYQLTGGDTWTQYTFTGDDALIPSNINKSQITKIQIHTYLYTGSSTTATQRLDDFEVYLRKYSYPEPTTSVGGEKIVGWVNDTWIAFTPAMCTEPYKECWSNVTKIVDLAVGARIAWCVYVNDTSNNWNATSCENPFSYITTGVNVITINLNATKVWWNDSLIASGVAKYANGASVNGSVLLSVDNTNYSCSQTDANGNWNCTFNAPIRIGVHTLTVKITDNSGYTFQNSTFLTVSPYYGRKPIGSIPRIVYELPMLIQDLDGEIKRVLARIIVWKD